MLEKEWEKSVKYKQYKPTYTFIYKGPVYRFGNVYSEYVEEHTDAQTEKQAANFIRGKLKKKFGFAKDANLTIKDDLVHKMQDSLYDYSDYEDANDLERNTTINNSDLWISSYRGNDIYQDVNTGDFFIDGDDPKFVNELEVYEYIDNLSESFKEKFKMNIKEELNRIDHKSLDNNEQFYDLRSLYESVQPKLSAQDKQEIKNVINTTNDPEAIEAVIRAKANNGEQNESFDEEGNWTSVYDQFLDIINYVFSMGIPEEERNKEIYIRVNNLYKQHKGDPEWDKAYHEFRTSKLESLNEDSLDDVGASSDRLFMRKLPADVQTYVRQYQQMFPDRKFVMNHAGNVLLKDSDYDGNKVTDVFMWENIDEFITDIRTDLEQNESLSEEANNVSIRESTLSAMIRRGDLKHGNSLAADQDDPDEVKFADDYDPSFGFEHAKDGDTQIQIQDREKHTWMPRNSSGKLEKSPRVASNSWGRVWKNGELDKQFEGPKYKVRQDMAKYLDDKSTNEDYKDPLAHIKDSKRRKELFEVQDFLYELADQAKADGYDIYNDREMLEFLGADLGMDRDDQQAVLKDFRHFFKLNNECINEEVTSMRRASADLKDIVLDVIQYFIDLDYDFPEGWLSKSWEDLKEGIQTGLDDTLEVSQNLVQYLEPVVKFNKNHSELEDPQAELENDFYDKLKFYADRYVAAYNDDKNESLNEERTVVKVDGKEYPVRDVSFLADKLASPKNENGLEHVCNVKYKDGSSYKIYDSGFGNMSHKDACAVKNESLDEAANTSSYNSYSAAGCTGEGSRNRAPTFDVFNVRGVYKTDEDALNSYADIISQMDWADEWPEGVSAKDYLDSLDWGSGVPFIVAIKNNTTGEFIYGDKDGYNEVVNEIDDYMNSRNESLNEGIDISDYEELSSKIKDGGIIYDLFRKIENGKGKWAAWETKMGERVGEPFEITYEQARGEEPINSAGKMSRYLGKKLLPQKESLQEKIDINTLTHDLILDKDYYYVKVKDNTVIIPAGTKLKYKGSSNPIYGAGFLYFDVVGKGYTIAISKKENKLNDFIDCVDVVDVNESLEESFGLRWQEYDDSDRLVTCTKEFKTKEERSAFMDELQKSDKFSNFLNAVNEEYHYDYYKTTDSNPLIYSVSIEGPYTNRSGNQYRIAKLRLVCGWDYVDAPGYERQGWLDADDFVDDVQSREFVIDDDQTVDSVLADEDMERCSKPHVIWHYNEEKDAYDKFVESINEDYNTDKEDWGTPYTRDQVEADLKDITNDFTEKEGHCRCYWEQEKNFGKEILSKHYNVVEVSDGQTGSGEHTSWVLSYSQPKDTNDHIIEMTAEEMYNKYGTTNVDLINAGNEYTIKLVGPEKSDDDMYKLKHDIK